MNQTDPPASIGGYEVISKLGRGSFADVYLVHRKEKPDRQMALKRFRDPIASNAVEREIAALKIMSRYPHAPKLQEVVRSDSNVFFVMDFIDGDALYDTIRREGSFSKAQALAFLRETLSELSYIHANNLLHTDIKLTNVMRHRDRHCFVDFGLCQFDACVATTTLTGGDRYLAPEVFRGVRTRASDIYALGCVLYYCVTREFLFGLQKSDPLERKIHAAMHWAPDLSFPASRKVRYILSRMLEKDPMKRATIVEIEAIISGDVATGSFDKGGAQQEIPATPLEIYREMAESPRRIVYAQYRYALLLEQNANSAQDESQAVSWFKASALAGYALAQHRLGFLYYRGRCGLQRNYDRAFYWFRKAAEQRHHRADYYLGRLYQLGRGVPANKGLAVAYYRRAIANGDTEAHERLRSLG